MVPVRSPRRFVFGFGVGVHPVMHPQEHSAHSLRKTSRLTLPQ